MVKFMYVKIGAPDYKEKDQYTKELHQYFLNQNKEFLDVSDKTIILYEFKEILDTENYQEASLHFAKWLDSQGVNTSFITECDVNTIYGGSIPIQLVIVNESQYQEKYNLKFY